MTEKGAKPVVVVDEAEWSSMVETLYLLAPSNREHLLASIAEVEAGDVVEFDPTIAT
jgi:PHD/YefM family antitoxin component YafN of YafNO toxin-antitoxin module